MNKITLRLIFVASLIMSSTWALAECPKVTTNFKAVGFSGKILGGASASHASQEACSKAFNDHEGESARYDEIMRRDQEACEASGCLYAKPREIKNECENQPAYQNKTGLGPKQEWPWYAEATHTHILEGANCAENNSAASPIVTFPTTTATIVFPATR